jgi:ribosomal-protein-alanine N-acetyltransferase
MATKPLEPFELIPAHDVDFDEVYAFFNRNRDLLDQTTHRCPGDYTDYAIRRRQLKSAIEAERKSAFRYAVMVGSSMIGYVRVVRVLEKTLIAADVQLVMDKFHQRNGYGTAVGKVVAHKAFEELGFRKLTVTVQVNHPGANKSLINAGFRRVGTLEKNSFINGEWQDMNLYEMVNPKLLKKGTS